MKKMTKLSLLLFLFQATACSPKKKVESQTWAQDAVKTASVQLRLLAEECRPTNKIPRSIGKNGKVRVENMYDWTSGFFPGSLWYEYELTGDESLKEEAIHYTNLLYGLKDYAGTHDLGFMMFCSYGNQLRLLENDTVAPLLISTANNLISRFDPTIKAIRSWDFGKWNYPVIIDNMMNLELLFWASEYTKEPKYKDIAIIHANTTLDNHFRDDMSSYHVISYNNDGTVESKGTFQGFSDDSDWARGQGWALYGYVVMYRFTNDAKYLKAAEDIAELIMNEETMPADQIPYWDFDAPDIPDAPRDVSAAAVISSALFELSTMVDNGTKYYNQAEIMLKNLSKAPYLAEEGSNKGFILKHATGHLPANSEIDTTLSYADYYYLEALKRYFDLNDIKYPL